MKISLNIENDKELRAYIKDLIKGQVLSIAREEIINILKEVAELKTPKINVDSLIRDEIIKTVKNQLTNTSTWNSPNFIQEEARKIIKQELSEYFKNKPVI